MGGEGPVDPIIAPGKERDGCEPSLLVATKNLGDGVENRVRDNGVRIPDDVR